MSVATSTARLLAALLVLAPAGLSAGSIDVNATAAFSGSFGLEVGVGSACTSPTNVTLEGGGFIFGTHEACGFLTANDVTVAGAATFRAGDQASFGDGFSVAALGSLAVEIQPGLSPFAWVGDNSPDGESTYYAAFRLNIDTLSFQLLADDELGHFEGTSDDGKRWFQVILKRNIIPPEDRLILVALEDGGGEVRLPFGEELMVPAGWNLVEIDWSAGPGNGMLLVALNGGPFVGLTGLDNDTGRIDSVALGAVTGEVDETSGSLYLDDFSSSQ